MNIFYRPINFRIGTQHPLVVSVLHPSRSVEHPPIVTIMAQHQGNTEPLPTWHILTLIPNTDFQLQFEEQRPGFGVTHTLYFQTFSIHFIGE